MAAVEAEAVGEFVLGEGAEVAEAREDREVGEAEAVFPEGLDQGAVADPGDVTRQVGGQGQQGRGRVAA